MENKIRGIASSAVEAKLGRCLLVRPARASKGPSKVVWQQLDHRIQVFTNGGGLSSNLRTTKINKREETLRFRSASQSDGPFAGIQRQVDGRLHFPPPPSACLTTQIRTKVFTSRTTGSDGSTAWHTPRKKNSAPSAVRRPREDIVPQCAKLIWTFQPTTGRQLNRPESKHSR